MIKKIKERESNFELLRIFAMLGIIFHHLFYHAVRIQLNDGSLESFNLYFNTPNFFDRLYIVDFALSLGKIGNVIFILISGYFLCSKKKVDMVKPAKKLLTQTIFVAFLLVLVSFGYHYFNNDFKNSLALPFFYGEYWFIGYYLFVIYFGSLFFNKFLSKLSREKYRNLLIISFGMLSFVYLRLTLQGFSGNLSILLNGVFIYALGGYISKYNPFKKIKLWHFISFIIISYIFMFISYYNYTNNNILTAIKDNALNYHPSFKLYDEWNITCLIIGVSIFEIFKRIKIKPNKVINYVASSVFMVYLIHENDFTRGLFYQIDWIKLSATNYPAFIGMLLLITSIIFVSGFIVYNLYNLVMKIVDKYCKRYINA